MHGQPLRGLSLLVLVANAGPIVRCVVLFFAYYASLICLFYILFLSILNHLFLYLLLHFEAWCIIYLFICSNVIDSAGT